MLTSTSTLMFSPWFMMNTPNPGAWFGAEIITRWQSRRWNQWELDAESIWIGRRNWRPIWCWRWHRNRRRVWHQNRIDCWAKFNQSIIKLVINCRKVRPPVPPKTLIWVWNGRNEFEMDETTWTRVRNGRPEWDAQPCFFLFQLLQPPLPGGGSGWQYPRLLRPPASAVAAKICLV